jgi:hypothetical protein
MKARGGQLSYLLPALPKNEWGATKFIRSIDITGKPGKNRRKFSDIF